MLKPGLRLRSAVDTTEIMVVKGTTTDLDIRCGGVPMASTPADPANGLEIDPNFSDGTAIGKRYEDAESGIELLCSKAGPGTLSIGDRLLTLKDAKPLPSSD
ncbi:MAG: hypothetical protein ABIR32_14555 [Ilumatobacteraceae bacterium]